MKIDLFNIDKFIEINNCPEVTSPNIFEKGNYPTEDGLLSYKLFGIAGSYDRKTIFGYIDLKKHFLHPLVYKLLVSMNRKFKSVIDGTKAFRIDSSGDLVEDNDGNTGIQWLYQNFDKLEFRKTNSVKRDNKVTLLSTLKKDELFVDKYLVIPAFYRDANFNNLSGNKISVDELNRMYVALISLTKSASSSFDFMGYLTENKIQLQLVEIYDYLIGFLDKKEGLIKNGLMSKTVDYSTRSVISAGRIKENKPSDIKVPFTYAGFPLAHLVNLFYPFFVYEIQSFAEEIFLQVNKITDDKGKTFTIINPMKNFTSSKIESMLNLFIKSNENRLDPLTIDVKDDETGKMYRKSLKLVVDNKYRTFTLLDLIYIVANKVCTDKHVYITRFPVENYRAQRYHIN